MKAPTFKAPKFKKPVPKRSPLPSLAKAKDPLKGVKVPDTIEEGCEVELDAVQQAFRDRAKQEAERFQDATDTGYYSCIVAENREQLDSFLEAVGLKDKDDLFIDIRDLAAALNIKIPTGKGGGGKPAKVDPAFARLVRD